MSGLAAAQYLLRWNDHLSNYGDIFLTLREEEEFVDCTLACEDGLVGAHRVVLAGCSPYLRDLFARVSNPHPVIYLLNTPRSLVLLLMEFIYRGQVHIPQNRLQQLVMLGRSLKIKGLAQIMVPISGVSEGNSANNNNNNTETCVSDTLTPMAFPHGLPLSSLGGLPFHPTATSTSNNNVSILSCDNGGGSDGKARQNKNIENRQEREEERIGVREEDGGGEEGGESEDENDESVGRRKVSRKRKPFEHIELGWEENRRSSKKKSDKTHPVYAENSDARSTNDHRYSTVKEKCRIAAYAEQHGIEDTKRYVKKMYKVKIRTSTITKFLNIYQRHKEIEARRRKKKNALQNKKRGRQYD